MITNIEQMIGYVIPTKNKHCLQYKEVRTEEGNNASLKIKFNQKLASNLRFYNLTEACSLCQKCFRWLSIIKMEYDIKLHKDKLENCSFFRNLFLLRKRHVSMIFCVEIRIVIILLNIILIEGCSNCESIEIFIS